MSFIVFQFWKAILVRLTVYSWMWFLILLYDHWDCLHTAVSQIFPMTHAQCYKNYAWVKKKSIESARQTYRHNSNLCKSSWIWFQIPDCNYPLRNHHFPGLSTVSKKDIQNCLERLLKYSSFLKYIPVRARLSLYTSAKTYIAAGKCSRWLENSTIFSEIRH